MRGGRFFALPKTLSPSLMMDFSGSVSGVMTVQMSRRAPAFSPTSLVCSPSK